MEFYLVYKNVCLKFLQEIQETFLVTIFRISDRTLNNLDLKFVILSNGVAIL